jgi:hypothetical protein
MRTIDESLDRFLGTTRKFSGRAPHFCVDWAKGEIVLTDACAGFLKLLYADDRALAHFHDGVITLQYYK